jgi:hypothetical protein
VDRYITEISPPRSRGTLASIPQLLTTVGVCTGYFTCYGSVNIASSASWRLPFALQAFLAFAFTVSTLFFLVESPRWLTACGRHGEALNIWGELGIDAAEREKIEEREAGELPEQVKMGDILQVFGRENWRRTALGMFLMGMQQASGIDGVLYVSGQFHLLARRININGDSMHRSYLHQQVLNQAQLPFLHLVSQLSSSSSSRSPPSSSPTAGVA